MTIYEVCMFSYHQSEGVTCPYPYPIYSCINARDLVLFLSYVENGACADVKLLPLLIWLMRESCSTSGLTFQTHLI